jgi:3-oxoacyl-[acyl-carrier-protein] synthase-1
LSALSLEPCNPFSKNRDGISIGEGGALFLITTKSMEVSIASVGESSDGYSMTSPDPEGRGAEKAMRRALKLASIQIEDVNYINLHGTGTLQNDSMEAKAVSNVFGANVLCSSTKSIVGHTLGAAGAVEAAFCWLMLSKKFNPKQKALPHIWDGIPDDNLHLKNFVKMGDLLPVLEGDLYVLSNSFAFGGSNASLLLKREERYD